ncbi:MAG: (E)-4-hydroxy-3-methylbut-2-enyl-diphosphate synthase [Acidobacteriota bacterium]
MLEPVAELPYVASPYARRRRMTREVAIGGVGVGGDNPIRIQSMTTPATTDVSATLEQIARLADAGCEIVRVTVPSTADAEALASIRAGMERRQIRLPLVADIHFSPQAALKAVPFVDKVRINPGNYADRKRFRTFEIDDAVYAAALVRLEEKFAPLVAECKTRQVALRIGTNHGSLSDRILNRYGDTPLGMVESALEFVRVCRKMDHHALVLSMKASNPMVAIQAYRLLVARMDAEGMDYPLHLGVTEAGDGMDGRVKSAIGIASLLEDGIGDTIRVSLTEDPVAEIAVARALLRPYAAHPSPVGVATPTPSSPPPGFDPYAYNRRRTERLEVEPLAFGDGEPIRVETLLPGPPGPAEVAGILDALAGPKIPAEMRAEVVEVVVARPDQVAAVEALAAAARALTPGIAVGARATAAFLSADTRTDFTRLLTAVQRIAFPVHAPLTDDGLLKRNVGLDLARTAGKPICWVLAPAGPGTDPDLAARLAVDLVDRTRRAGLTRVAVAIEPGFATSPFHTTRLVAARLDAARLRVPLILVDIPAVRDADAVLGPSAVLGGLLCDGIGDGIRVESRHPDGTRSARPEELAATRELAFTILQGARVRIVKTEFISCPSCGRTQFDLEETTRRIKARTHHLKGLKIAVMGCIVNGPGEMADADFGYVGWGPGKIALFVGHDMVARDIPAEEADQRLVELIQTHGKWIDPPAASA